MNRLRTLSACVGGEMRPSGSQVMRISAVLLAALPQLVVWMASSSAFLSLHHILLHLPFTLWIALIP